MSMVAASNISARRVCGAPVVNCGTALLSEFIEWDVRNWSAILDFWQATSTQTLSGKYALEIGSRHGGLSLWLAMQGARVICSDLNGPSEKAVRQHRARGVGDLIEYRAVDATSTQFTEDFDAIVFKSVLGGIGGKGGRDAQRTAIMEMHKALKKGGELFFAENLVASFAHQVFRKKFVRWSSKWRYVSISEMKDFLAPFAEVKLFTSGFAGAFGRTEWQRNLLGVCDRALFDHLVPRRWQYLIAGVAKK